MWFVNQRSEAFNMQVEDEDMLQTIADAPDAPPRRERKFRLLLHHKRSPGEFLAFIVAAYQWSTYAIRNEHYTSSAYGPFSIPQARML